MEILNISPFPNVRPEGFWPRVGFEVPSWLTMCLSLASLHWDFLRCGQMHEAVFDWTKGTRIDLKMTAAKESRNSYLEGKS